MSGPKFPQAGTEVRWGAKRVGGGERRVCEIGEEVRRWRKDSGSTVRQDRQGAPVGSMT